MLDKKAKDKIIEKYRIHESDTGSPEVQVALLTEEIKGLASHLEGHKKDHSSRRGLIRKVSERRRLLRYLEREDKARFDVLTDKLRLKVAKKLAQERAEEEAARIAEEEAALLAKAQNSDDAEETEVKKENEE
jgi:small subunit ribosomal protein S15